MCKIFLVLCIDYTICTYVIVYNCLCTHAVISVIHRMHISIYISTVNTRANFVFMVKYILQTLKVHLYLEKIVCHSTRHKNCFNI